MKKPFLFLKFLLAVVAVTAAVMVWDHYYPSGTWRYKMTVEIETPEGVKTGSAVREVSASTRIFYWPHGGNPIGVKGEAVVIDLGERGTVFALVGGDNGYRIVFSAFPKACGLVGTTPVGIRCYRSLKNAKTVLTPDLYPMFVYFRDPQDPKTVENLRETGWCLEKNVNGSCIKEGFHVVKDRFEEAFGQGVRLKSVTIEMTDEKVTWGVEKWLPWLSSVGMGNLGGGSFSGPKLYERLSLWDFKKGTK